MTMPFDNTNMITSIHEKEFEIAKKIVNSKRPVIIITEKSAKSIAGFSKYFSEVFPNVPVVFETSQAQKNFFNGMWCERAIFQQTCVGHFEEASGSKIMQGKCSITDTSDCVMIFGEASDDLRKQMQNHVTCFIHAPTLNEAKAGINLAIIGDMERDVKTWGEWNKRCHQPRLCV